METIIIGDYYTYDDGLTKNKKIMFVIRKGKYEDEDAEFYETISLFGSFGVHQLEFDVEFFQDENIRLATKEEVNELRSHCSFTPLTVKNKMDYLIPKHWGINNRPNIVFNPDEPLGIMYLGAYDTGTQSLIFRSEFLILVEENEFEKILLHELCHWYLHITGEEYRDRDIRFAEELIKVGAGETANLQNDEARKAFEIASNNLR
ncbi:MULTISPECIES: protein sprT [Bacillus cereus group]|uniref:Protein sprT n=1 Tax=Bacillus cereus TaxID=1396 RepID=A0A9X6VV42_BACCE|nr:MULTISPECIES: protein sprT [Bacillus cereus group]PEZ75387.1 protein sprT [Bacillus anthracis]MDX5808364.1 protein sprT [Bacillus cereus group sp. BfR-BA-02730]PES55174.1 protein sprT [Bacillus cereus]PFF45991.1 protein sprT [Bacillus cereus]PFQ36536.1 protein sprT [Bacillus cereus]